MHVHAKFQLSSLYPDGLRQIFDHFWRKFQDFSWKLFSKLKKKIQTWVCNFILNLAKLVHAKFQLSSFYPDGLRHILTIFEENFRIFQENSLANSIKFPTWACNFILNLVKHVHAKFQLSSFYPDGFRQIVDHFSRKYQDFSGKLRSEFKKIQI
jgi:hypothetical protein